MCKSLKKLKRSYLIKLIIALQWSGPKDFEEFESFGIVAGEDNGNKVNVGRAKDEDGNFVPARIVLALKTSFFAYKDQEAKSDEFDVLDTSFDYKWKRQLMQIYPTQLLSQVNTSVFENTTVT